MAISNVKPGRNDLCACGSGKKYKRCCGDVDVESEDLAGRFFGVAAVLAGITLVAVVGLGVRAMFFGGEAQSKRVWSAEHGHFHDVNGGEVSGAGSGAGPGKVWNEEHGHYHDAANAEPVMEASTPVQGALEGLRASELDAAREKVAPTVLAPTVLPPTVSPPTVSPE